MVHKASHWLLITETAVQTQANLSATNALISEVMQDSQT